LNSNKLSIFETPHATTMAAKSKLESLWRVLRCRKRFNTNKKLRDLNSAECSSKSASLKLAMIGRNFIVKNAENFSKRNVKNFILPVPKTGQKKTK